MKKPPGIVQLDELRNRLREAEETLAAIRTGEVDSLIVTGPNGAHVFSLRGAEQPYRVFVEQMQQGALTLDLDGTILYANRRMSELLDVSLERVIGAQFQTFLAGESEEGAFSSALSSPANRRVLVTLRGEGGHAVPVSLAFNDLPLEDDARAIAVVVTDLTEHEQKRELAAALDRLYATQERLRIQNQELVAARKLAEAASDAKDEFLATLSHELRTPLTPVFVTAQALESDPSFPAKYREDISMIRRNVELEARLIDDLLDLTRIVRGKIELRPADVDVNAVLDEVVAICAEDVAQARVHIRRHYGEKLPTVRADPVRLQQVLWNLVRNAVKFTPAHGEVELRTYTSPAGASPGGVTIDVVDSGIGMEPETIERIFSPFEQAGREITRRFGGLGLGLAISRRLVELHGGSIRAASLGTGKGSTFSVTFRFSPAPGAASTTPAAPPVSDPRKRLRILLVEDHEDTRRTMVRLLSGDHDVHQADSVQSGVRMAEAAAASPYDLIISDLGLPDGTGLDLMRQIRARNATARGICLSGYGMAEDLEASKDAGFAKHLVKPVSITSLRTAIAEATATVLAR